jgi:hypothetical protein
MKKTLKKGEKIFLFSVKKKEKQTRKKKIRTTVDDVFRDKIQNTSHSNDMIDLFNCFAYFS